MQHEESEDTPRQEPVSDDDIIIFITTIIVIIVVVIIVFIVTISAFSKKGQRTQLGLWNHGKQSILLLESLALCRGCSCSGRCSRGRCRCGGSRRGGDGDPYCRTSVHPEATTKWFSVAFCQALADGTFVKFFSFVFGGVGGDLWFPRQKIFLEVKPLLSSIVCH